MEQKIPKKYQRMLCKFCYKYSSKSTWAQMKARKFESKLLAEHASSLYHIQAHQCVVFNRDDDISLHVITKNDNDNDDDSNNNNINSDNDYNCSGSYNIATNQNDNYIDDVDDCVENNGNSNDDDDANGRGDDDDKIVGCGDNDEDDIDITNNDAVINENSRVDDIVLMNNPFSDIGNDLNNKYQDISYQRQQQLPGQRQDHHQQQQAKQQQQQQPSGQLNHLHNKQYSDGINHSDSKSLSIFASNDALPLLKPTSIPYHSIPITTSIYNRSSSSSSTTTSSTSINNTANNTTRMITEDGFDNQAAYIAANNHHHFHQHNPSAIQLSSSSLVVPSSSSLLSSSSSSSSLIPLSSNQHDVIIASKQRRKKDNAIDKSHHFSNVVDKNKNIINIGKIDNNVLIEDRYNTDDYDITDRSYALGPNDDNNNIDIIDESHIDIDFDEIINNFNHDNNNNNDSKHVSDKDDYVLDDEII